MRDLTRTRIWLIGASYGIGEQLALQLSKAGATLILSARSEEKLDALTTQCAGSIAAPCDVTDSTSIRHAYDTAIKHCGGIDIVLYNAGAYDPMSCAQMQLDKALRIVDVNLNGALRMLDVALPDMLAARSGTIVLVGSVAGYVGLPKACGYGASKAALIHLAENLRQDMDGTGVTVQLVNPGFVETRLTDKNDFSMPSRISAEDAASRIIAGIRQGSYEIHFPKRFTYVMKILALLPKLLFFWLSKKLL